MAIIQVAILMLFLIFYVSTREVWVVVKKNDKINLQVHLPIIALHLDSRSDDRDKRKAKRKDKLSPYAYIRIISAVIKKIESCDIEIHKIVIPIREDDLLVGSFSKQIRQQFIIFSIIAYFRTKTKKITIDDNTFILSPDISKTQFHLTAKPRLYEFVQAIMTYKFHLTKEKKRARMDKNVRE